MLFPRIECPIGLAVLCVQTIAHVNVLLDFHRSRETWKGGKKNRIFRWISMKILKSSRQRDWEWFRRMGRLWPFAFGNSQCSPEMGRPVFPANSHYPPPLPRAETNLPEQFHARLPPASGSYFCKRMKMANVCFTLWTVSGVKREQWKYKEKPKRLQGW